MWSWKSFPYVNKMPSLRYNWPNKYRYVETILQYSLFIWDFCCYIFCLDEIIKEHDLNKYKLLNSNVLTHLEAEGTRGMCLLYCFVIISYRSKDRECTNENKKERATNNDRHVLFYYLICDYCHVRFFFEKFDYIIGFPSFLVAPNGWILEEIHQ
jgi:hypothetical protein